MTTPKGSDGGDGLAVRVGELRLKFDSINPTIDRDAWAFAAFRLGTALAETAGSIEALQEPIGLLREALRVFSESRAPVEHGRVATVLGTCLRRAGDVPGALAAMQVATRLLRGRVPDAEHAAAESNLATALMESGDSHSALERADVAIEILSKTANPSDTEKRALLAAYFNRGLIRQSLGRDAESVLGDFKAVLELSLGDDAVMQRGMAHHAIGVFHKASQNYSSALGELSLAADLLSATTFPMQHAICRFNAGITYEAMGTVADLRKALRELSVALSIFDQRLHAEQRRLALSARTRVIDALLAACPDMTISDHQIRMLCEADSEGQFGQLRELFGGLEPLPRDVRSGAILDLMDSLVVVPQFKQLLHVVLGVLMEFPDAMLSDALSALVAALDEHPNKMERSRDLDDVVHTVLHGPQRVRVRDMLEYFGWQRP